jgi:hypothetical protein
MRPILRAPILKRRRADRIAISTSGDFMLGASQVVAHDEAASMNALPYCLDFARRRFVYAVGVDAREAQRAPFYYLHLRRTAQSVLSIPWEGGDLHFGAEKAPVFLFSPGRCGSTLLSRILSAANCPNVSEPDFYTQATSALWSSPFNPLREKTRDAAADMGSDLCMITGDATVVKLRAESCRAPGMLVQPKEKRTLFMTRGFESWARSNIRAFRNPPGKTVGKYLRALTSYAWLKHNTNVHLIRYEDLLADPVAVTAMLGAFLGRVIPAHVAAATMKEDSQAGTPLEQGVRGDLPGWERRFDATMALWNSARLKKARDRLDVSEAEAG